MPDMPSERATETVKGRARQQYGDPRPIAATAAEFWNVWMKGKREIEDTDVQMMMALHKVAREKHAPQPDNLTDICGYVNIYERTKGEDEV